MANFVSHASEVVDELNQKSRAALEAVGQTCASHARNTITAAGRIDSGSMRDRTIHEVEGQNVYIGVASGGKKAYAIYNEFGTGIYIAGGRQSPWAWQDENGDWHWTRGMPGIHMIKNCVANNRALIKRIIETIMKGG